LITLFVPFSNLQFQNTESGTKVRVVRYVLFFIPWKTEEVSNVSGLRADITSEKYYQDTSENRRKGQTGVSLATGQLVILNGGPEVKVQADPDLAYDTVEQFNEFVASKSQEELNIPIYASWALSYLLGGAATFFCIFYVFCALAAIVMFPFKMIRSKTVSEK